MAQKSADDYSHQLLQLARGGSADAFASALSNGSIATAMSSLELLSASKDKENGNSPLHFAALSGSVDIFPVIQSLCERRNFGGPQDSLLRLPLLERNYAGDMPLHIAASRGDLSMVRAIYGVFCRDDPPWTADGPEGLTSHDSQVIYDLDDEEAAARLDFILSKDSSGKDAFDLAKAAGALEVPDWLEILQHSLIRPGIHKYINSSFDHQSV